MIKGQPVSSQRLDLWSLGATFEELGEELKRATKRGEHEAPTEDGEDVEVEVEFDEWGIEITDDDSSDEDGTPAG